MTFPGRPNNLVHDAQYALPGNTADRRAVVLADGLAGDWRGGFRLAPAKKARRARRTSGDDFPRLGGHGQHSAGVSGRLSGLGARWTACRRSGLPGLEYPWQPRAGGFGAGGRKHGAFAGAASAPRRPPALLHPPNGPGELHLLPLRSRRSRIWPGSSCCHRLPTPFSSWNGRESPLFPA